MADKPLLLLPLLLQTPSLGGDSVVISNARLEERGRKAQDKSYIIDAFYIETHLIPRQRKRSACGSRPGEQSRMQGMGRIPGDQWGHGIIDHTNALQPPGCGAEVAPVCHKYLLLTAIGFL